MLAKIGIGLAVVVALLVVVVATRHKLVGADFEKGLTQMKTVAETSAKSSSPVANAQ